MGKRGVKGDAVVAICKRNPDKPTLWISKRLHAKHPGLFPTVASARDLVRYHRNERLDRTANDPIERTCDNSTRNMLARIPKTSAKKRDPFVIHGAQRILRLSDIHFPIHDEAALGAALNHGKEYDPTIILLDGDVADLHDFMRHEKRSMKRYVREEVGCIVSFFDLLREEFPKARIIWKEGNHEERLRAYLISNAPALMDAEDEDDEDDEIFDLPGFVRLVSKRMDATLGVEWVNNKRIIRAGELSIIHGHELGRGGGGVNPARWLFLRTGENAICGHFHRTSEHSEPSLSRKQRGAWSTGCLCDLSPEYMPENKWNHGFATIDVDADGGFMVSNHRIIDGRVR